jgi:hypothetical protein
MTTVKSGLSLESNHGERASADRTAGGFQMSNLARIALLGVALLGGCGVVCPTNQTLCSTSGGQACVNLKSDNFNCGACGAACAVGQVCNGGACEVRCSTGLTNCSGACRDVTTDINNCGSCGKGCDLGQACVKGVCSFACPTGQDICDGVCRDLTNDPGNCGSCATKCGTGQVCNMGMCALGCQASLMNCNGSCRDVKSDGMNCGSCGKVCDPGNLCVAGVCKLSCQSPLMDCGGGCKDLRADVANCGGCGMACDPGHVCSLGKCTTTCAANTTNCSGSCRDLMTDPANCNSCGNVCASGKDSTPVCLSGACGLVCAAGASDCNKNASDGCEVKVASDPANCGACGVKCPPALNAAVSCTNAQCGYSCNQGWNDCDGLPFNGCESNPLTDPKNCGACGKPCANMAANAQPGCKQGACTITCLPGFGDCNNNVNDGCEVSLSGDNNNCGKCGNVCPNNTPLCANGMCIASSHNTVNWNNYNSYGGGCNMSANGVNIGAFQWMNMGSITWKACMLEASKRNALVMSPTSGPWSTPGWFGHREPNSNFAMTGQWSNYIHSDIGSNVNCNIAHEPQSNALGTFNSVPLNNVTVYDGNVWHYNDLGVMYIDQCMLAAGQSGASVITPATIGLGNGDGYWDGILHTCSVYSWIVGGTNFSYDNTQARVSQKSCMVGYMDN